MANIAGPNPQMALIAPDYQTQQTQVQRSYALAQALREQSLQDSQAGRGSVSWTQGLARIADALAAKKLNKQADAQSIKANQAYATGLRGMFGANQGGGDPSVAAPSPPNAALGAALQGKPIGPGGGSSPAVPNGAPLPQDPLAPLPDPQGQQPSPPQAPQAAPPQMPPQQPPQRGPWSLTGNPQQDMAGYVLSSDEYGKAVIGNMAAAVKPNDMEIAMNHAREALARGDVATATALLGNIQKQNYIAPISARQGVVIDPITHQPIFQVAKTGDGQVADYGPDGKPTGIRLLPGAAQAASTMNAAEAGGKAAGGAPYEMMQVFDQGTGQMKWVPKSDMTGGSGPGGSLNSHYGRGAPGGGGFAASAPMGAQAGFNTLGTNSANQFADIQTKASDAPQRVQALREMTSLISGPNALQTGPARAKLQDFAVQHGLPFGATDQGFVFNKDAARYTAQLAGELGLNGSDQRLGMVAHATPGMQIPNGALKQILPVYQGLEFAKMARATAAGAYSQQHPTDVAGFESHWRQNYDPSMFTALASGGPAALASAPPHQRAQWLQKYRALKGMGVNFGEFAQ